MATDTKQPITSELVDMYLAFGIAVCQLGALSAYRPDLEFRLCGGRLTAGYVGEDWVSCAGVMAVEPVAENWQTIVRLAAALPRR